MEICWAPKGADFGNSGKYHAPYRMDMTGYEWFGETGILCHMAFANISQSWPELGKEQEFPKTLLFLFLVSFLPSPAWFHT